MPIASAITAIATCQLSDAAPSHDDKRIDSAMARATIKLENVRTLEKTFNLADSINVTVAIFKAIYAKMQA
jgi:hypothetical protein